MYSDWKSVSSICITPFSWWGICVKIWWTLSLCCMINFSKSYCRWFVDSIHSRLSPWDHLVKSRQLGSSGQQFANFVSKNLPRECSLPTANLSDQALDNAHGAWFWLSDIKCKKSETSLWHSILQVILQYDSLTITNFPPLLSKQAMISRLPCRHHSPGWRLCHNRTQRH